jgi:hypothetical protein
MKSTKQIILAAIIVFLPVFCSPPYVIKSRGYLPEGERKRIIETAEKYLGTKYKNGGAGPTGFDCSGFVMYVYGKNGMELSRTAIRQYEEGKKISMSRIKPGDLLFFKIHGGNKISHVGIYIGDGTFIHAPSSGKTVSYATIRNPYWRKRYCGAASYFSGAVQPQGYSFSSNN